ncbi:hypothetical protein [Longimicrobium sp.]|uniref:hypothetical protein n=1 Tax=Longimicrobium sp. TaxID=2029185 RepID=UPI002E354116|nr:hypothetical protein [Longimicrobium sp.]HEX6040923.1 hypothetical protein [Longimicrobium sp.]
MRRTGHARARVFFLCLAALLAAACGREDTLPPARQIPLATPVEEGATLAVDSADLLWVGTPGRLTALDTAGRARATVTISRDSVPRVLWRTGGRLVIRDGRRLSGADAAGGAAKAGYGSTGLRAAARDPRGRWVFTANRRGGIMGLDPASLQPRWSWPETGGEALGMAVSPLADRVYVSVDRATDLPAAVQVRDAGSGRVLMSAEQAEPLHGLAAGPDGTLYGYADGVVVRLRHGPQGLRRVWTETPPVRASGGEMELRVDPSGARVAVFGRGRGARLAVLDARTGRVLGLTKTAPLDAAFGVEGRLYLLEPRVIREVR